MNSKAFIIVFLLIACPGVLGASLSSGDYSFVVLDAHWGGLVTDDGTNYFLITESTIGILPGSGGTTFYTLPPFLSSENHTSPSTGPSTSGDVVVDEEVFDEELGVFMSQSASKYPLASCNVRLENYRGTDMVLDYRWWVSQNLMSDYDDSRGDSVDDVLIDSNDFYSKSHSVGISSEGDYWCKLEVMKSDGTRILLAAQKADIIHGFDINYFFNNLDWTKVGFVAFIGLTIVLLLIWSIKGFKKSHKSKSVP